MNLAPVSKKLVSTKVTVEAAMAIVEQMLFLIDLVEDLHEDLKGSQKFAAVLDGLKQFVRDLGLDDEFEKIAKVIKPVINVVVAAKNALGIFKKVLGK